MNGLSFKRAAGMAILRRPWASRIVLGWGLGRALSFQRASKRWTFLSGVGLGAGLMYLLGRPSSAGQPAVRHRSPSPARRATSRRPAGAKPKARG